MDRIKIIKKLVSILTIILLAVLAVLIAVFVGHVVRVNRFNAENRVITPNSTTTEAVVDIHPRGQLTDSWEKRDTAGIGVVLNAKIYELIVTNNSKTLMNDWKLRIDIKEECYLNNGWCGSFEIHQIDEDGTERVQTVDLRNYKQSDLKIEYRIAGQDLLIPLKNGDYIYYIPDSSGVSGEVPLKGNSEFSGSVTCGFIMYSRSGNVDLSNFEFNYTLHKTYFSDEGIFFVVAFSIWLFAMLIISIIFVISVQYEQRFMVQSRMLDDVFKLCCNLSDSRDYYSKEHSRRVADYSRLIAEKMGMDKSDCDSVFTAALLHNVGNNLISEQILRKMGRLTSEEYAMVKTHTTKGAELLKDIKNIPHAEEAALYHHERYDGTGYPMGKKGDEIPLIARIIAVADAYDAMNNDRPYRKKFMKDQIREEFIKNRGTQFDPLIVGAFLDIMGERDL